MLRLIGAVIVGFAAWILVGTLGFLVLRATWSGYAAAEAGFTFTSAMLLARLLVAVTCSIAAGWAAVLVAKRNVRAAWILGGLLLLMMLPLHYSILDKFPIWYHLAFLITLVPLVGAGGRLARPRALPNAPA